ncbi:Tex family protein [Geomicrobium sp. JCM 19038]|uniref:Tex family protein n=1 Tax=Geomicrobium sp. JCM 19038 TaxID=1460635 RepID=UPI00045F3A77|nr:Tex family protein [Geomicrobium sp. JCM 19038]GAK09799.1 transcription accessory protein [Geomicrobium sp. JCM 19038]
MFKSTGQEEIVSRIAISTGVNEKYTNAIIQLSEEGNTIPFIARYRKEQTGNADETNIKAILDLFQYENQLEDRKQEVYRLIDEQDKLTPELSKNIHEARKLQTLEDLYRPYKQKKRTRATIAKEKGLEPLAKRIYEHPKEMNVKEEANGYLSEEHKLNNVDTVIAGALDIISEWISDEATIRQKIRTFTYSNGTLKTSMKKNAEDEESVFEMYYEFEERIKNIPSYRVLAVNRGEKENVLKVTIDVQRERIEELMEKQIIKRFGSPAVDYMKEAIADSYKRLIAPSIEREIRNELTDTAEDKAIQVFSGNLKQLLLQPPFLNKVVLGVDPAYRTGCKLAVVDGTGKVLDTGVIYPTPPRNDTANAAKKVTQWVQKYQVDMIAIGNGTASRETEAFIADVIADQQLELHYLIVNEAGASVYSASDQARSEFPQLEVEERSAISIARRLQDPLSELVKIDPKSIGVGQYQHDVQAGKLSGSLDFVVETAVNLVGVNVNTASSSLLQYVAGLNQKVAQLIVTYREENGQYRTRKDLKNVPRLGAKTYEQAAGFLRIIEGEDPLDQTPIHPESYTVTRKLLKDMNINVQTLGKADTKEKLQSLNRIEIAESLDVGSMTLNDILDALIRPNRDPREDMPKPILKSGVMAMEDLEEGMELEGTVRNVVDFGAFIDIGVKQDGLVHISKLADRFVRNPQDVVAVGDIVTVWVEQVDQKKGRIALTMLAPKKAVRS